MATRAESTTLLKFVDAQLELLENLNRRMEELRRWEDRFPLYRSEIVRVNQAGLEIGAAVKAMDETSENSEAFSSIVSEHDRFIMKYDVLWRTIQGS